MKRLTLFLCFASIATTFSAFGAVIAWDGGAGTNNWTDANNWSTNTVPTAADDAQILIAATVTYTGTSTIRSLFIDNASATLTINAGATLIVTGGSDLITIRNGVMTNNGDIDLQSAGDDALYIGISSTTLATFNNSSGATLDITNSTDMSILMEYGNSTINNSGTIDIDTPGDDGMRINRFSTVNNNTGGLIDIDDGVDVGIALDRTGRVNNSGTIDINNCTRHGFELFVRATDTQYSRVDNLSGGVIDISNTQLNGSANGLRLSTNAIFNNDGTLTGDGNLGPELSLESTVVTFTNTANGSYEPGNSPGTYNISATSFNLGTSTFNAEINGLTAGTQYDVIDATGSLDISSAALVVNWGAYTPESGDSYTLITAAGGVTGTFASETIPTFPNGTFTVVYNATTVVLQVGGTLPVEFVALTAEAQGQTIDLNWSTASEMDNQGFEVQRMNGTDWETIGFVEGVGNSTSLVNYDFTDRTAIPNGTNYYRLKQIDFNGAFEYSKIVSASFTSDISSIAYPNPTTGTVRLDNVQKGEYAISNGTGNVVQSGTLSAGLIDLSGLPQGVYFLEIQTEGAVETQRILKR